MTNKQRHKSGQQVAKKSGYPELPIGQDSRPLSGADNSQEHCELPGRRADGAPRGRLAASDIPGRPRDAEALHSNEERLKLALDAARMGSWDWNILTNDVVWNTEHFRMLGYEPDSFHPTYQHWAARVHPDDLPEAEAAIRRAMEQGGDYVSSFRVCRPDGAVRWMESRGRFDRDIGGRPVRNYGILQDITERKTMEILNRTLNSINAVSHSTPDVDEIMQFVISESAKALGCDTAAASLRRNDCWVVSYVHGFPEDVVGTTMNDEQEPHALLAIRTQVPLAIADAFTDERVNRKHMQEWGVRSVLVVPLAVRREGVGVLFFNFRQAPCAFGPAHLDFAAKLSATVSLALENVRLFTDIQRELLEKKKAEEALQLERDLLQTVMNGAKNSHLVYLDRDFNFVRVNETYAATCGYRPEEMIGKNHFALYPHAENEAIFARVRDSGEPFSIHEKPFEFPDHPERGVTYWDWLLMPVKNAAGRVEGLVFSLYETTLHKQAEEQLRKSAIELQTANAILREARRAALNGMNDALAARRQAEQVSAELRESENRYRTLFNSMNEGFAVHEIITDADGQPTDYRFLDVNPAFEALTGLKRSVVAGRTARQILPKLEPVWIRNFGKVALTGESVHFENYSADLGRHYEIFAYCPAPRQFAVMFLDITKRKQAEDVLRRSRDELDHLVRTRTEELVKSEGRYRELVENANSIIMRLAPEHTISFFNEYAESFFGFSKEEVLGRNVVGTIVPDHDSGGQNLRALMTDLMARPELYSSIEHENICKDGRRVWVHWSNRAIRDAQGRVTEILAIGNDVTERRRMQAEKERIQERLRALAERLAVSEERERWDISRYIHDTIIQNLSLSSMRLGTAQRTLAAAGIDLGPVNLQAIRTLVDDAIGECRTVMSELTPSLLYEIGLVPALRDLADAIRQRHGVQVMIEESGPPVNMDNALRGLLFQSARELIMNALKHAGPKEIRVDVTRTRRALLMRVRDDGCGFDPEAAVNRGGAKNGGFGLLNIRQRVEAMGGLLNLSSEPGRGATATITLPRPESG